MKFIYKKIAFCFNLVLVFAFILQSQSELNAQTYKFANAGTAHVNGIYVQDGTHNAYPAYKQISGSGTNYVFVWAGWWTVDTDLLETDPWDYYWNGGTATSYPTFPITVPLSTEIWSGGGGGSGLSPPPVSTQNTTANMAFVDGSSYSAPAGTPGTSNNPIGRYKLTGSAEGGVLQALTISLTGTLTGVSNVKLWSSTDASFGGDTQLGSAQSAAASVTFSGFNSLVDNLTGTYYFVSIDIAGGSTGSITAAIPDQNSFTFAGANQPSSFTSASLSSAAVPLPVELTSFSATLQKGIVILSWSTATEVNNYGFEIERACAISTKGRNINWKTIGFIEGHGNSNSPKEYGFADASLPSGTMRYRLKQIDADGTFEYSGIVEVEMELPTKFELAQNYPNPFNPATTINYSLPKASNVTLKIYNSLGQEVATLMNTHQEAGNFNVAFDASNLTSGIYFYSIRTDKNVSIKKMLLLK